MEKVAVVSFNKTLMGIKIGDILSFTGSGNEIYITLKENLKFKVEQVLKVNFLPQEIYEPSKEFYSITGANYIFKLFKFENNLAYIINIKNFSERLSKNETK